MPLSRYDKYFGGKKGAATEAHSAMKQTYKDPKKAEQVFYALKNKRKGKGK